MKASTGFILTGGQSFFAQSLILNIYGAAPEPESANDASSGVLLVSIKDVHFVATGNGYRKAPGEIWSNETTIEVSADATYFRLVTAADHGEASTTFPRLQGVREQDWYLNGKVVMTGCLMKKIATTATTAMMLSVSTGTVKSASPSLNQIYIFRTLQFIRGSY